MGIFRRIAKITIALTILLLLAVFIPSESSARQKEKVRVSYIDGGYQFGEPGHDPFLRDFEPGGEEWRNRHEEREIFSIPGSSESGDGQHGSSLGRIEDLRVLIRIIGEKLFISLEPLM